MDGYAACQKKLRKVYLVVQQQTNRAKEVHVHSCTLVSSLINLLEQLAACERVSFDREPLVEFEGLEEKLRYKLAKASESVLTKIHEDLNILREVSRKLSECRTSTFDVYTQHALRGTITREDCTNGSPTCPSIADMLEWLTVIDRSYAELYEEKLEVIESVTYEELSRSQQVLRTWKTEGPISRIKGIMEQIAVYLADQTNS